MNRVYINIKADSALEAREEMWRLLGGEESIAEARAKHDATSIDSHRTTNPGLYSQAAEPLNPIKVPDEPITDTQAEAIVAEATGKPQRERGKPSPGHARRTKAEIAEDEAADKADAAVKQAGEEHGGIVADKNLDDEKGAISDSPEDRVGPEDDEATAEQDAADEAVETAANSNGVKTLDDVRAALGKYVTKFGMAAAQEDGPKVLGMVCGEGVSKISAIPDDKIVAVIAGIEEMTAKNPFKRAAA